MSEFRFKQFSVINDRSAMKVNTDGVLLGAAVSTEALPAAPRILDVGTGTGTIALMLAQRVPDAQVDAVEVDAPSALEASANFASSPWPDRLYLHGCALQSFVPDGKYDLVVSNPPYFDDSLRNPDGRKADARHTASLSYREILAFAAEWLTEDGAVAMILPSEVEKDLLRCARSYSLRASRILRVCTTEKKAPRRIVAEFSRTDAGAFREDTLVIMKEGRYTDRYTALLKDFLITL